MANEAVCIETPTRFARRNIAAAAVLPVGTICKLTEPNTVVASSASNDPFGGIVWEIASTALTTFTQITVALDGVWDIKATTATIGIGVPCSIGGANLMRAAIEADWPLGTVFGRVEEEVANDEVARVSVGGNF